VIRSVALVTNPAAGRGRSREAARRAAVRFAQRGVAVREVVGNTPEQSRELARAAVADGTDALVVVGGDGMIHLALPAVVGTGTPLGVIPAGTGNDQARAYGWPRSAPEAAADVVADGLTRTVDVGVAVTADGRRSYFGSVLASGFDSLVSDRTNRMRWPRGRTRYNLAMLAEFANLRALPCTVITAEGETIAQDVLLVAVGNTASYGGGMRICPAADPADGLFDVTIGAALGRRRVLAQLPSVYRGTHVDRPEARTLRTAALSIDSPGINAYADGEYLGPLPVEITLVERALTLLVPV
jgi:diacylglycerol kinase (ATP)